MPTSVMRLEGQRCHLMCLCNEDMLLYIFQWHETSGMMHTPYEKKSLYVEYICSIQHPSPPSLPLWPIQEYKLKHTKKAAISVYI